MTIQTTTLSIQPRNGWSREPSGLDTLVTAVSWARSRSVLRFIVASKCMRQEGLLNQGLDVGRCAGCFPYGLFYGGALLVGPPCSPDTSANNAWNRACDVLRGIVYRLQNQATNNFPPFPKISKHGRYRCGPQQRSPGDEEGWHAQTFKEKGVLVTACQEGEAGCDLFCASR